MPAPAMPAPAMPAPAHSECDPPCQAVPIASQRRIIVAGAANGTGREIENHKPAPDNLLMAGKARLSSRPLICPLGRCRPCAANTSAASGGRAKKIRLPRAAHPHVQDSHRPFCKRPGRSFSQFRPDSLFPLPPLQRQPKSGGARFQTKAARSLCAKPLRDRLNPPNPDAPWLLARPNAGTPSPDQPA